MQTDSLLTTDSLPWPGAKTVVVADTSEHDSNDGDDENTIDALEALRVASLSSGDARSSTTQPALVAPSTPPMVQPARTVHHSRISVVHGHPPAPNSHAIGLAIIALAVANKETVPDMMKWNDGISKLSECGELNLRAKGLDRMQRDLNIAARRDVPERWTALLLASLGSPRAAIDYDRGQDGACRNPALALVLIKLGRLADARAYFRMLWAVGHQERGTHSGRVDMREAQFGLARVCLASQPKRVDEANEHLLTACAQHFADARVHSRAGRLLLDHDLLELAASFLQKASDKATEKPEHLRDLAVVGQRAALFTTAHDIVDRALELGPFDSATHACRADGLFQAATARRPADIQKLHEAVESYTRAVNLAHGRAALRYRDCAARALRVLAAAVPDAQEKRELSERAVAHLMAIETEADLTLQGTLTLAFLMASVDRPAHAQSRLRKVMGEVGRDPTVREQLKPWLSENLPDPHLVALTGDIRSTDGMAWQCVYAGILEVLGFVDEAQEHFDRGVQVAGERRGTAHLLCGAFFLRQGKLREARAHCDLAVHLDGRSDHATEVLCRLGTSDRRSHSILGFVSACLADMSPASALRRRITASYANG